MPNDYIRQIQVDDTLYDISTCDIRIDNAPSPLPTPSENYINQIFKKDNKYFQVQRVYDEQTKEYIYKWVNIVFVNAEDVSFDSKDIEGMTATNVQSAIEETGNDSVVVSIDEKDNALVINKKSK